MNSIQTSKEYAVLLNEVRARIRSSQYAAFKAVLNIAGTGNSNHWLEK